MHLKGKEPIYWLIDDSNRTEALRRQKAASTECLIYSGTPAAGNCLAK